MNSRVVLLVAGLALAASAALAAIPPGPAQTAALFAAAQDPDVMPEVVKQTMPIYPESAKKDSLQGKVFVEAMVDTKGNVSAARVTKGVRKDLDDAALACIRQWEFKPALKDKKPVSCTIVVPFQFKLK
jgi:protein TonB